MRQERRDLVASVRQRLLNLAHAHGEDFQRLLTRYASERLLYRLGRSQYREEFVLKGALLFSIWLSDHYRPTKDVDLLGYGGFAVDALVDTVRAVCTTPAEDDGLTFLPESVAGAEIREQMEYGGIRLRLLAMLGNARIPLQVDVGFGDPVTPAPLEVEFPTLLDLPAPRIRICPRETVVAEKLEATIRLGIDNSRMKDFYDLWILSKRFGFDGAVLTRAIAATFNRRGMPVPEGPPVALTDVFPSSAAKQIQWRAFVVRMPPLAEARSLEETITALRDFLLPPLQGLREGGAFGGTWPPGGLWKVVP